MNNPHKIEYFGSSPKGSTNNNVISTTTKRKMEMKKKFIIHSAVISVGFIIGSMSLAV
jgi:hypothetical protein